MMSKEGRRIKILFLIHDLGQGGAEKVLVNLVNHLDREVFDITVMVLFGGGVNETFLKSDIHFKAVFPKVIPGNSKWMKVLNPERWHKLIVKERYDIEVSYLEGPSARVISGCTDGKAKLVSWIHVEQHSFDRASASFRNKEEAIRCYNRFDRTICVSQSVQKDFCQIFNYKKNCQVLYNTVEDAKIREESQEEAEEIVFDQRARLVAVGTLKSSKGYDRMLRVVDRLKKEKNPICLYILGTGPLQEDLKQWTAAHDLTEDVVFLGYKTNPYKYMAKCDLFICASYAEGFSTAVTESLIVGTPVCTVEVSGMKELLGENNEYGIVTDNSEEAFYQGIKHLLNNRSILEHYRLQAMKRGETFKADQTVKAVEEMLLSLHK